MAINTALLIASPTLQDYLVDKDTAQAMSAGTITLYQDNSRTTLKNWYYQSGTPGAYTYITLPNPLTLSAIGTIADPQGNDTIPFFYPYSETDNQTAQPYYIVVKNSNGEDQFTRANFPFIPIEAPNPDTPTLENILVNNVFWRNVGSLNVSSQTNSVIAPGAHDGFTNPDIRFLKDITGATDVITFTPFGAGVSPLKNDITPEYYLNFNCSASQAGETLKCIQIPISLHIKTLESVPATITIQAENVTGSASNQITIGIYQFLGTGAISQPATIVEQTLTLTNGWQKYAINFVFPSAVGQVLGHGGDDALYLQIGLPKATTCNINIALPELYLSDEVPTNSFTDYDKINSVISAPRTGDLRISLNYFSPFGWVPANDGGIGSAASGGTSRANIDTWQLYNFLWTFVGVTYAPMVDTNPYGVNAITDFSANRAISLTKTLGRAISSLGLPSVGGTNWVLGQVSGSETHNITTPELPQHTHDSPAGGQFVLNSPGGLNNGAAGGAFTTAAQTGGIHTWTSQTAMSLIQPTTYCNVYFKL